MRLYVPELYRIQHAILARAWDSAKDEQGVTNWPTVDELAKLIKKPQPKVLRAVNYLQQKELAHHDAQNNLVYCRPNGKLALFKEDLLEEGWEKFKANLLRWVQIVGITSGALIGIATFVINVATTNKNKVEIELLKRELQTLKQKREPIPVSSARVETRPPVRDSIRTPSSLRRQDARPGGKSAAQPNEGVKVGVGLFVLTCAITINTRWR
ncbi:hypothetical protein CLV58_1177 [Spirosoma oryzae]|uniref:Helix-turn-helix protein n=1 Tax=Spirosoma oryzae TaxID=1469603 RepID=A0A2T0SM04_9BACT|nr:hypothetical protein [Spirosoma oryzae]PRY34403.1 hypothetical protein CLV58_1177 [Spirosoma oryzae]